jgi:hypothetical protein
MNETESSLFNIDTIYPTGDFLTAPTWKLKVGSHLLTGRSTYLFEPKTQTVTLDLSFKIPMSSLLEQATPVMVSGVTSTVSSGAKVRTYQGSGFLD